MKYLRVGKVGDLHPGETKTVSPERGEHIVLCNVGGNYYAIRDTCTHDGGMLGYGALEGSLIECPRHGAKFDVTTGEAVELPAVTPVHVYPLRIQGEDIEVDVEG